MGMKVFFKKLVSYILLLHILVLTIFSNPIVAQAKEKTGEQMVAEIIKELDLEEESYFNKVVICGRWIYENISYDYEGLNNGTEVRTLKDTMLERKGVCEGYARVFKEFMDQIGAPCLYISDDTMRHVYNMVLMNDNKWYLVEPQSALYITWERDIILGYIEDLKEEISYLKFVIEEELYFGIQELNQLNAEIVEYESKIRVYEEELEKLDKKGELIISSKEDNNNFLNGSGDFENHTVVSGRGYDKFVELAKGKVYGYPVATTKLRTDPDKDQKYFINKSSVAFTESIITMNAATCKTNVVLPLKVENYEFSDLTFEIHNLVTYDLSGKKEKSSYNNYYSIFESLYNSRAEKKLNLKYYDNLSTMVFQISAETIFGNKSTASVTIVYPQLTKAVSDSLNHGIEAGKSLKLRFTEGTTKKDFDISIDKNDRNYAEYDSKTGIIKAKKSGYATLRIKSKTNKNYQIEYTIYIN